MSKWVVIRYKFNEDKRCWDYDGTFMFNDDGSLLNYLKTQASRAADYRHEITTVKEV